MAWRGRTVKAAQGGDYRLSQAQISAFLIEASERCYAVAEKKSKSRLWKAAVFLSIAAATGFAAWNEFSGPSAFGGGAGGIDKSGDATLRAMIADVQPKFQQFVYTDKESGLTVPYNLYVPVGYDGTEPLPLIYFIADSSVVGRDVTAPLSQGYGALVWASAAEQAKHPSLVLVPEFPEVIIDDHGGFTMTDYVEVAARLVETVAETRGADMNRLYATGQSMGCMTLMYLSARHPDLFAAQIFVSGQWDTRMLGNLADETFFYIVAEGDPKASAGQRELFEALTSKGARISTAKWDARWPNDESAKAVTAILSESNNINFVTFTKGSVMPEGASANAGSGEHMYSFDFAYNIEGVRDWLFEQSK